VTERISDSYCACTFHNGLTGGDQEIVIDAIREFKFR